MITKTMVWVTESFVGFHRWKEAPDSHSFLRSYHRHVFHVKIGVAVDHNDRDVEFFALKDYLKTHLEDFEGGQFELSCEQIADILVAEFVKDGYQIQLAEVSEDGENGATILCTI